MRPVEGVYEFKGDSDLRPSLTFSESLHDRPRLGVFLLLPRKERTIARKYINVNDANYPLDGCLLAVDHICIIDHETVSA